MFTALQKTQAAEKNEILFRDFNINYNNEPEIFRRGSVILKRDVEVSVLDKRTGESKKRKKRKVVIVHEDMVASEFWLNNAHLLSSK